MTAKAPLEVLVDAPVRSWIVTHMNGTTSEVMATRLEVNAVGVAVLHVHPTDVLVAPYIALALAPGTWRSIAPAD
jgi:hypothetical protein